MAGIGEVIDELSNINQIVVSDSDALNELLNKVTERLQSFVELT